MMMIIVVIVNAAGREAGDIIVSDMILSSAGWVVLLYPGTKKKKKTTHSPHAKHAGIRHNSTSCTFHLHQAISGLNFQRDEWLFQPLPFFLNHPRLAFVQLCFFDGGAPPEWGRARVSSQLKTGFGVGGWYCPERWLLLALTLTGNIICLSRGHTEVRQNSIWLWSGDTGVRQRKLSSGNFPPCPSQTSVMGSFNTSFHVRLVLFPTYQGCNQSAKTNIIGIKFKDSDDSDEQNLDSYLI